MKPDEVMAFYRQMSASQGRYGRSLMRQLKAQALPEDDPTHQAYVEWLEEIEECVKPGDIVGLAMYLDEVGGDF